MWVVLFWDLELRGKYVGLRHVRARRARLKGEGWDIAPVTAAIEKE